MPRRPAYQEEPSDDLRISIWSAGEISPLQLFRIASWKSARGLASLAMNDEALIRQVTQRSLEHLEQFRTFDVLHDSVNWDMWTDGARGVIGSKTDKTGLLALEGVGYPMATALVCYLAPRAFPVIDRWTVKAVFGEKPASRWHRAVAYAAFTRRLRELAPEHYGRCRTIHEVDQAVMNAIIGCDEPRDRCTHVPYPAIALPD